MAQNNGFAHLNEENQCRLDLNAACWSSLFLRSRSQQQRACGRSNHRPTLKPVGDVELLVEVQTLEPGSYSFTIESQGTVRPLTETILSAEVSGSIISVSPKFISGGVFAAGEELMPH